MQKNIYLECVTKKSNKFYEMQLLENELTINYGRIDRGGKKLNRCFNSSYDASMFFDKQLKSKLKKYSIAKIKKPKYIQLKIQF